jgi:hypothetical protein
MSALGTDQALTALILGPFAAALSWIGRTDRFVNRVVDSFIQNGRATDLDRDIFAGRLRAVAVVGMAIGVFVFGLGLADLLFI